MPMRTRDGTLRRAGVRNDDSGQRSGGGIATGVCRGDIPVDIPVLYWHATGRGALESCHGSSARNC